MSQITTPSDQTSEYCVIGSPLKTSGAFQLLLEREKVMLLVVFQKLLLIAAIKITIIVTRNQSFYFSFKTCFKIKLGWITARQTLCTFNRSLNNKPWNKGISLCKKALNEGYDYLGLLNYYSCRERANKRIFGAGVGRLSVILSEASKAIKRVWYQSPVAFLFCMYIFTDWEKTQE